ncbi:MAG: hypothetical protein KA604_03730 [Candidatus Saccharimonas sp.]|nr:hypothetical protein [Candidatus Saccharimonas sp.]
MTEKFVKGANSRVRSNKKWVIFFAILAVVGFGVAGYAYKQYLDLKNNPQQVQDNKMLAVKEKVAGLIALPSDEKPTLMTVTDVTKLKDQPFFKNAQNDDVVLIFPQAKKAIIYREKENKLINVGPIAITSDAAKAGTANQSTTEK